MNRYRHFLLRAFVAVLLVLTNVAAAFAQDAVSGSVRDALNSISGGEQSAFCYAVENGQIQGVNPNQPVKIASVMKLMTTFWALETLGSPNFRYRTKIYYNAARAEMHIEGANDPFFHRDRLYYLISNLNRGGVSTLNRLTADSNFKIATNVVDVEQRASEFTRNGSMIQISSERLAQAFNTDSWASAEKKAYSRLAKAASSLQLVSSLSFKVNSTEVVSVNPLAGLPGTAVLEFRSAPLSSYLKRMNIMSANPMADELFYSLGGLPAFKSFMRRAAPTASTDGIYSGSGLWVGPPRQDTTMSCSSVVEIIRRLDRDLESRSGMGLADVMLVAGLDTADMPSYEEGGQTLIVKTGTIDGGKNLAGSMSTSQGEVYFGIFMQGKAANAKDREKVVAAFARGFQLIRINRRAFLFSSLDSEMGLRSISGVEVGPR